MSEKINVDHAFNPEARQAQEEFDIYLENRPYQDDNGNAHNPANGQFINADQYHNEQRDLHYEATLPSAYGEMGILEVARELAKAELSEDRTKMHDLNDVLLDKMIHQSGDMSQREAENLLKGGKDSPEVTRTNAMDEEVDPETRLMNRVIDYKDAYKAKLQNVAVVDGAEQELTQNDKSEIIDEEPKSFTQEAVDELVYQYGKKVDPEFAGQMIDTLKGPKVKMPEEVIGEVPANLFFKSDDPDFKTWEKQNLPTSVSDWIDEYHPDTSDKKDNNDTDTENDVSNSGESEDTPENDVIEMGTPEQEKAQKMTWRDRVKSLRSRVRLAFADKQDQRNADGRWDTDISLRADRDRRRIIAGVGLGAAALITTAVMHKYGMPSLGTEEVKELATINPFGGAAENAKDLFSGAAAHAAEHADKANDLTETTNTLKEMTSFDVESGQGFSHIIAEMDSSLSQEQLAWVTEQAQAKGFLGTENTYTEGSELRISNPHEAVQMYEQGIRDLIEQAKKQS